MKTDFFLKILEISYKIIIPIHVPKPEMRALLAHFHFLDDLFFVKKR